MTRKTIFCLLCLVGVSCYAAEQAKVEVAFNSDCETVLVSAIRSARQEILVAIFAFSRRSIARELIDQSKKGVNVAIKMDAGQADSDFCKPVLALLREARVSVTLVKMSEYHHMHNKFVVVDKKRVVTGSYNFSTGATKGNWENVVSIESTTVAEKYKEEWGRIQSREKTR